MIDAENHLMKHKGVDRDDNEPTCPYCKGTIVILKSKLSNRGIVYIENMYTCLKCKTDFNYPMIDLMAEDNEIPYRKERKWKSETELH